MAATQFVEKVYVNQDRHLVVNDTVLPFYTPLEGGVTYSFEPGELATLNVRLILDLVVDDLVPKGLNLDPFGLR